MFGFAEKRSEPLRVSNLEQGGDIGMTGFEPATSWSQTKRSTKLSYIPAGFPVSIPEREKPPRLRARLAAGPSFPSLRSGQALGSG